MNVAESAVAQANAPAKPKPESQSAAKPKTEQAKAPEAKPASSSAAVVKFTSQKSEVVERQNAPKPEAVPASKTASQNEGAKANAPEAKMSREIGRDYSVDQGQVVVKVIDKDSNEVVREIPPEELRRIKQAISEINRNSVASTEKRAAERAEQNASRDGAQTQPDEHGVDVTT
jgi:flagellar protein FlaG